MITYILVKTEKVCAICSKAIAKKSPALYDRTKSKEKQHVHVDCLVARMKAKGTYKEPPF